MNLSDVAARAFFAWWTPALVAALAFLIAKSIVLHSGGKPAIGAIIGGDMLGTIAMPGIAACMPGICAMPGTACATGIVICAMPGTACAVGIVCAIPGTGTVAIAIGRITAEACGGVKVVPVPPASIGGRVAVNAGDLGEGGRGGAAAPYERLETRRFVLNSPAAGSAAKLAP